ncbi:hypothetical protein H9C73_00165 [Marinobacterium sp. AK62]|uniref:Uncharacterized protein n=1 Tax=Marinobacterium alkalitolerans TaxID=1542925 RepID=A0ABS3Z607_9GAMM|nr:hypothetical protein [Marinobacterium alkalitolerans]MBP0047132.1 hypothetical protein [Marinobacterium alkalitolerans]
MNRPFLSRRQLWLLIILLPGIILLLTLLGPMPGEPQILADPERRVFQQPQPRNNYRLALQLPLPPPETADQWLAARLIPSLLSTRLTSPDLQQWLRSKGWQGLQHASDPTEWRLSLLSQQPPTPAAIEELLDLLGDFATVNWSARLEQLSAAHYLAQQSEGTQPFPELLDGPLPSGWHTRPAQLVSQYTAPQHWRLSLLTPEQQPLVAPQARAAEPTPESSLFMQLLPHPGSAPAGTVHQWRWPAPSSADEWLEQQLALQCLRHQTSAIRHADIRMRWRAWHSGGQLSLFIPSPSQLELTELLQCPQGARFEALKQEWRTGWTALTERQPQSWLLQLARYGLSPTPFSDVTSKLSQIERASLNQRLQQGPASDSYRRLIFPSATEDRYAPSQ